ncbi:hypothetical protein OIDMADRAFT_142834 [Oidiodendron maius Zn]|uniref:F-box domain-containing protein n=1 Tax=Oidiodendron maius (strain Zn) TaxID=913774 RepID=A0A0C3HS31_OIDMZ|nr:hypothetical protein OIDMADRAFT_142834 [Oidiodendron maius Zn]
MDASQATNISIALPNNTDTPGVSPANAAEIEARNSGLFNLLPTEIRQDIFNYLLVNPELETAACLRRALSVYHNNDGIDLSPAILRTCKNIYKEASVVLYESNKFAVGIFGDKMGHCRILNNRYHRCRFPRGYDANIVAAFKLVKHWKVIFIRKAYTHAGDTPTGFVNFCRALTDSQVKSLEISVERQDLSSSEHVTRQYLAIQTALGPLELLRNLPKLAINEVTQEDNTPITLPHVFSGTVSKEGYTIIPEFRKVYLRQLTQGNSPIFYVFKALKNLMAYAKAFERNRVLKDRMEGTYNIARCNYDSRNFMLGATSLIKQFRSHPVEMALTDAIIAARRNDDELFDHARCAVIDYLEPQYKRIAITSGQVAHFVNTLMNQGGDFECALWDEETCDRFLASVLQYKKMFLRDVPDHIRAYIESNPKEFELAYSRLPRESAFRKLANCWPTNIRLNRNKLMRLLIKVMHDMYGQYLEIRRARIALYDNDILQFSNFIDKELWRSDVELDWGMHKYEPGLYRSANDDESETDSDVSFTDYNPGYDADESDIEDED